MANVKQVHIEGLMPFDGGEHGTDARTEMLQILGSISLPVSGLRIEYQETKQVRVPNQRGGRMTLYPFTISGMDGASYAYFDRVVEAIKAVDGEVHEVYLYDIEEREVGVNKTYPSRIKEPDYIFPR